MGKMKEIFTEMRVNVCASMNWRKRTDAKLRKLRRLRMNRILNEVKNNVLTDESKWCQEHFAVNKDGRSVPETASTATRFCMMGACKRAANNLYGKGFEIWHKQFTEDAIAEHDAAIHSLLVILLEEDKKGLATFNDDHDRTFC